MQRQVLLATLCLFCIFSACSCFHDLDELVTRNRYSVLDYGAVGDGKTDCTQAFLRAWEDVCEATGDKPTMVVPAGRTYLLQPVTFRGPCNANKIHVLIKGTIIAPNKIESWHGDKNKWIIFRDVDGLSVNGGGEIDGQGHVWWSHCGDNGDCKRPSALSFVGCNGLNVNSLRHVNSQRNHISITSCHGVHAADLQIVAPEDSPNTDGIDISSSSNVHIQNSMIGTGDDCIAINGGSSYINITDVMCGPGHGISIGSLGKDGSYDTVENIHVERCTLRKTQNGVRIKTWQGGAGYVRRVMFSKITLVASENPIIIDQYYGTMGLDGTEGSAVKISDIIYRDIRGSSADAIAIKLDCSNVVGCSNVVLDNVHIVSSVKGMKTHAFCNNVNGIYTSAVPPVNCLKFFPARW